MRRYLFSRSATNWESISFMTAGFTLGNDQPWAWLAILVFAAAIEVCVGYPDEQ